MLDGITLVDHVCGILHGAMEHAAQIRQRTHRVPTIPGAIDSLCHIGKVAIKVTGSVIDQILVGQLCLFKACPSIPNNPLLVLRH